MINTKSEWILPIGPIIDKGQPKFLHIKAFGENGPIILIDKAFFTDNSLTLSHTVEYRWNMLLHNEILTRVRTLFRNLRSAMEFRVNDAESFRR